VPLSSEPIDAVLLDAGGVLLLPDPDKIREAFAPLGATPDDETCARAHYVSMREVDRVGRRPDWAAIDLVLAREAGVPEHNLEDTVALIEDIYLRQPWVPVKGAAEALLNLQSAGLALAVVSNAEGTMEEQLLTHRICSVESDGMAEVAVVVDSTVVGIEKPDPAIFDIALEALDIPADRCIYVGDTVHFDVEGARAAGLHPVHVDPYELCPHRDHEHTRSLPQLAGELAHFARARP
jgi:putative hydrolase of the HAD superfamily